jgi:uncharacterized protein (TIGR02271 family)
VRPESDAPDAPFPGARPQVPVVRLEVDTAPLSLPLEARLAHSTNWGVRLPVRAEVVRIEKQVVVVEQVTALRHGIVDRARLDGNVRKEELRLEAEGEPRLAANSDFAYD